MVSQNAQNAQNAAKKAIEIEIEIQSIKSAKPTITTANDDPFYR